MWCQVRRDLREVKDNIFVIWIMQLYVPKYEAILWLPSTATRSTAMTLLHLVIHGGWATER
jgi:hypothetical protein